MRLLNRMKGSLCWSKNDLKGIRNKEKRIWNCSMKKKTIKEKFDYILSFQFNPIN